MIDQQPPAAQVAPAPTDASQVPADIRAILELAMRDGEPSAVERLFDYARRARPDAAASIDALHVDFQAQVEQRRQAAALADRERLSRPDPFVNWAGQVEFGAALTTGAGANLGLLASADVERKGVNWTHKLQVRGEIQETGGVRAVERVTASWQPRYAFGEHGYTFGLAQYEHDPALGYDTRYSLGVGAGLRLGRPGGLRVLVDGGPALRRTERPDASRSSIAGRGSADLDWPLTDRLTLQQKAAAFFEDGKANGLATSALDTRVSSKVKLRLSYEYRFENERAVRSSGSTSRASLVFGL